MNRLEAHRHIDVRAGGVPPSRHAVVYKIGVILEHYGLEAANTGRNGRAIFRRDRPIVEEVASVVELHVPDVRHHREGCFDLSVDGAQRDRFIRRVLPQVAHKARERALTVGDEHGAGRVDGPTTTEFVLYLEGIGLPRIEIRLRTSERTNPAVRLRARHVRRHRSRLSHRAGARPD